MTVAFLSGRARRAGVALGAVSAGLLVLSACDKPTPLATVTVGTDSVHTEAASGCYDTGGLKESQVEKCVKAKAGEVVEVSLDDRIRFGVDPEIAENGWTLLINGQPAEQEPYKKTYRTINASPFFNNPLGGETADSVDVTVLETEKNKAIGVYRFTFKKV
ncbi:MULTISPECIES: DUF2771 domain-containing protein [unclassified Streptomyces]|uniref:DUF2771 domain-containing protein n=1 Tax=unclassified Streptomyces TaxID=2593676 RepID=UPI0008DE8148|nr:MULTISPECIES: DUF2771 domain-containing protein [unclassified Streptomyces]OII61270.1 DUF2771 domain-containing protein [Streptomyces sp. CC77]